MGKLEFLELELLHDIVTENVGGGKEPAAPTGLLVGDWASLEVDFVVEDVGVGDDG